MTSTRFDAETTVKTSTKQLTLGQELKEKLGGQGLEENAMFTEEWEMDSLVPYGLLFSC